MWLLPVLVLTTSLAGSVLANAVELAHAVTLSTRAVPGNPRSYPRPNGGCDKSSMWKARLCHRCGDWSASNWFELCYTRSFWDDAWKVGETPLQTFKNGLDSKHCVEDWLLHEGAFNTDRMPKIDGTSRKEEYVCPGGMICIQVLDKGREPHVVCAPNWQHSSLPQKYYVPQGGYLQIGYNRPYKEISKAELDEQYYHDEDHPADPHVSNASQSSADPSEFAPLVLEFEVKQDFKDASITAQLMDNDNRPIAFDGPILVERNGAKLCELCANPITCTSFEFYNFFTGDKIKMTIGAHKVLLSDLRIFGNGLVLYWALTRLAAHELYLTGLRRARQTLYTAVAGAAALGMIGGIPRQ